MSLKQAIIKGIAAHGLWKAKLRLGIEKGRSEISSQDASQDNLCELGQWLYSEGLENYHHDDHYHKVKTLHASMHKVAGQTVHYIEEGDLEKAEEMLTRDGVLDNASLELVMAMRAWEESST